MIIFTQIIKLACARNMSLNPRAQALSLITGIRANEMLFNVFPPPPGYPAQDSFDHLQLENIGNLLEAP